MMPNKMPNKMLKSHFFYDKSKDLSCCIGMVQNKAKQIEWCYNISVAV